MHVRHHFKALLHYYSSEEGGLITPVSSGYRTGMKFPFESKDYLGTQIFLDGDLIYPGDSANVDIHLLATDSILDRIYEGMDFELLVNSNTIGTGVIVSIY